MSPLTATAWMGLGPAILLLSLARKSVWLMVAHLLAAYAGFVAFVASAGYAFGGTNFWLINDYTAIAIHTAIGLLVAVAAAPMTHPETGRSGEPTSELQSLMRHSYAVFCLKKKRKRRTALIKLRNSTKRRDATVVNKQTR